MSNPEDNSIANIVFRGMDGNECEAFIAAIREIAYAQGRDEDDRWMLRLATTKLRGNAIRWHARLDESTRRDWSLFLQALLEKYPSVEGLDETDAATSIWSSTDFSTIHEEMLLPQEEVPEEGIQTASDSRNTSPTGQTNGKRHIAISSSNTPRFYDPSLPSLHTGRLRIVYEQGQTCPQYIRSECRDIRDDSGTNFGVTTFNKHESLIVTFYPLSETNEIGWVDGRDLYARYLGIRLSKSEASEYYSLIAAKYSARPTAFPYRKDGYSWCGPHHQDVSTIWNILHDGKLEATLSDLISHPQYGERQYDLSESYKTTTFFIDIFGVNVYVAKPFTVPNNEKRAIIRAKIVFEPL